MNLCIRKQAKSNLVTWICLHITTSCQFKYLFQKWQLTAGFYTLKAQLISSDIPFESTHFDSVKIRWDFMAKDSEANSKEWNNGLLMLSWATTVYTYPFVLKASIKLQRIIIAHTVVEVYGFISLSQNYFNLDTYFFKTESFENRKKRSWTRNFDHCGPRLDFFFLRRFPSTKHATEEFFSQSNFTSLSTKLFHGIMNSASFDLSISALVLILDISRSHKSQVVMQVVVNWPYVTWDQAQF